MTENFATYRLGAELDVFRLADGLLYEVAEAADLDPPHHLPDTEKYLQGMVSRVGPARELQKNIETIREVLGDNANDQIADWIERSGIMSPLDRAFMKNEPSPDNVDALVWSGGVANWMIRRMALTQRIDPQSFGKVYIPLSSRTMKPSEHQLVETYHREHHTLPTEYDFATRFVKPILLLSGLKPEQVEVINTGETEGDEVLKSFFYGRREVLDGTLTVVSNAPNAVQAAGQIRVAARTYDQVFDSNGDQLFMVNDSFPLARAGEKPATHQNPSTALGQLVRNALFLERNKPDLIRLP